MPILIDLAARASLKEISVVSESIPHLRRGAIKDFKKIMVATNRWRNEGWNSTLLTYRFSNGSYIEFFSADQEEKLRGARRQVLYINECNNITFESYHQLAIRTSEDIWLDFNPTAEFWAHTEVLKEPDSELIVLNYLDNEALPDTIKKDIEQAREKAKTSEYWANWWKVYGLGQIGTLQGAVFENWEQVDDIDRINCKFVSLGLDWGFTNDPTALIAVWKKGDDLYVEELIYERNLTNQDIASKMKAMAINRTQEIIADSAEPKSIEEVHRLGFNIHPAKKGADSIRNSIDILRRQKIHVTKNSVNLIKEFREYKWKQDKNGKMLDEPVDFQNHAIDALRYVALNKLKVANSGKYFILQA